MRTSPGRSGTKGSLRPVRVFWKRMSPMHFKAPQCKRSIVADPLSPGKPLPPNEKGYPHRISLAKLLCLSAKAETNARAQGKALAQNRIDFERSLSAR